MCPILHQFVPACDHSTSTVNIQIFKGSNTTKVDCKPSLFFSFYAKKSVDHERPFSVAVRVVSLFSCLSRLAPSVTRVCILAHFVRRAKKKERLLVVQIDRSITPISPSNRPQNQALGSNYKVCGVYSPEPCVEVYCVRLNFNISKLVYYFAFSKPPAVLACLTILNSSPFTKKTKTGKNRVNNIISERLIEFFFLN